jgi:uncharacterized OB-fold protein
MRDLAYPFLRCTQCEGIALSPRRLCSHCETQEAMTKATIKGRCTYCRNLTVVTHRNLRQHTDHRYALICDDCEEGYGSE